MTNNEKDLKFNQLTYNRDELDKLRELVIQHKVCWEVWPEYHINLEGEKVQIGFELDLVGTHYHPERPPLPGCAECMKVYEDLEQIAQWIMPKEERDSRYKIGIFDSTIQYAPKRKLRKDITLTIKILHREGFDQPVDGCEVECLKEMESKLKDLGAQKVQWREPGGVS